MVIFRDLTGQSIRLVIGKEVAALLCFYPVLQHATHTFVSEENRFWGLLIVATVLHQHFALLGEFGVVCLLCWPSTFISSLNVACRQRRSMHLLRTVLNQLWSDVIFPSAHLASISILIFFTLKGAIVKDLFDDYWLEVLSCHTFLTITCLKSDNLLDGEFEFELGPVLHAHLEVLCPMFLLPSILERVIRAGCQSALSSWLLKWILIFYSVFE